MGNLARYLSPWAFVICAVCLLIVFICDIECWSLCLQPNSLKILQMKGKSNMHFGMVEIFSSQPQSLSKVFMVFGYVVDLVLMNQKLLLEKTFY